MSRKLLYLLILITVTFVHNLFSQPTATVNLTGGITFPLGALYAKFGDTDTGFAPNGDETYYLTNGYSYGLFYKQGIGKKRQLRITGTLNFTFLGQTKDYPQETIKLRQSFLSIGIGGEWNLAPKRTWWNPFVGAEVDVNIFGGYIQFIQPSATNQLNLNSTIRYGIGFGGGIDIQFHQSVGAIIGLKYCIANILGKKYEKQTGTTYGLNDAEHTYNNVSYPARNINVFQIYGGFSYYFGR